MSSAVFPRWVRAALLVLALWPAAAAWAAGDRLPAPARAGVLDLRGWDFRADGIAPLDGQWLLHWGRFDEPRSPLPPDAQPIEVPGPWNDAPVGGTQAGSFGHATYRLTVQCNDAKGLALHLPVQHSAARWFVNGQEVAQQGSPGATAADARPGQVLQIAHVPQWCARWTSWSTSPISTSGAAA